MPHARIANVAIEDRVAYSLSEVAGLTGLSISGLYLLIGRGQLRSIRIGGRRLITREALDDFLSGNVSPIHPVAVAEHTHDDVCARAKARSPPMGHAPGRTNSRGT
jgi:excisionase family DNA binding protein